MIKRLNRLSIAPVIAITSILPGVIGCIVFRRDCVGIIVIVSLLGLLGGILGVGIGTLLRRQFKNADPRIITLIAAGFLSLASSIFGLYYITMLFSLPINIYY